MAKENAQIKHLGPHKWEVTLEDGSVVQCSTRAEARQTLAQDRFS